jgi:tetratricopeptide (TPR) repeat protein
MSRPLLLFLLALSLPSLHAEALLRPLPEPDLTQLPAETAQMLRERRADFEAARANLVGPPLAAAFALMGSLYAQHGVYEAAHIALANAAALEPEDFGLVYMAGLTAMAAQQLARAQEFLDAAMRLDPDYPATRIHLASVMARLDARATAERLYREAIAAGTNAATAHVRLGQIAMERGDFEAARGHFTAALEKDPEASSVNFQLGAALRGLGREREAEQVEQRAGPGPLTLSDPLGRALFGPPEDPLEDVLERITEGELATARAMLDAYLRVNGEDQRARALQARVLAGLGEFGPARALAESLTRDAPESATAFVAAGAVEEAAGAEARAIDFYARAVSLDGDHAEARLMLADALMRQQRYDEAARQYRALADADGERAVGLPRLVAAEVMAGRCDAALAAAAAARERHPRDGVRAEIFVRVATTCPAARDSDRQLALQLADAVYRVSPDAYTSEAAAMAAAAAGLWEDAQDLQRQALFELAKQGDQAGITRSRALLERFQAEQRAELPWPAGHPLFAPPRMQPQTP